MPNKRSRNNRTPKFYCSHCHRQLWRVGGPKYFLFYQGAAEIQQGFKLTHKKAKFLATQNPVCVDPKAWLEEFFCEEHGQIWMHLSRSEKGQLNSRPAQREDWKRTSYTPDPDRANCSVSDFTYRMSRRTHPSLSKRFYES